MMFFNLDQTKLLMFCKFKEKEITGVFPGKGYLQRLSPIFSQILNTAEAKKKATT